MRLLFALLLFIPVTALAAVDQSTLDRVAFSPAPGAHVPLDLRVRDDARELTFKDVLGEKPALLMPVDYLCRTTCGPALAIVSAALTRTGLRAGKDYGLILVGIDPATTRDAAQAFAKARIGDPAIESATRTLTLGTQQLDRLTKSLGYSYVRDDATNSFAHPLGAVALTAQGAVSRLLSPLALDADDLRLALLEAGDGRIGSWTDRLVLLCYGFDAAHGIYTARITLALRLAGGFTVALLLFWLLRMMQLAPARRGGS